MSHLDAWVIIRTVGRDSVKASIASARREGFKTTVVADGPIEEQSLKQDLVQMTSKDEEFFFYELPCNWGHNGHMAANLGIALSDNEWIIFLDDDDELVEGTHDILAEFFEQHDGSFDILIPGMRYSDGGVVCIGEGLQVGNVAMAIYKRKIFSTHPFKEYDNVYLSDYIHIEECSKDGYRLKWLGKVLYNVRPHRPGRSGLAAGDLR